MFQMITHSTELTAADLTRKDVGRQFDITVDSLNRLQVFVWLAFFALFATSAQAQGFAGVTADLPDARTLKVQQKVEELFQRGDFDRAYFIYRNELAPIGDKYAQYMVGFMHMAGMGVEEDPVAASAWYRLAAERGTPQFVEVRNMLMSDLNEKQRRRSDQLFLEIRRQNGDLAILLNAIRSGLRDMGSTTGSRLSTSSSPLTVIELQSSAQTRGGVNYYQRVERKLVRDLTMLSEIGDFPNLQTDPARVDIKEVEQLVNQRLETIQD